MDTSASLESLYTEHNKNRRGEYFVTMENERGSFLRNAIGTGKRVLDIGCRDGALTRHFVEGNNVLGLDIDSAALERAKKIISIETKQIDLHGEWGIEAHSFDTVVAAEVLEHLYYPEEVVKKIVLALRDNGKFVGSIPYAYSVQAKIRYLLGIKKHTPLQDPTHINHFRYKEFKKLLEKYFSEVVIIPIISRKLKPFSFLLPNSFAHMLLFVAKHPKK